MAKRRPLRLTALRHVPCTTCLLCASRLIAVFAGFVAVSFSLSFVLLSFSAFILRAGPACDAFGNDGGVVWVGGDDDDRVAIVCLPATPVRVLKRHRLARPGAWWPHCDPSYAIVLHRRAMGEAIANANVFAE